jgi:hypothetical protein
MRPATLSGAAALVTALAISTPNAQPARGFTDLFNGRSLNGWKSSTPDAWVVAGNELTHKATTASTLATTFQIGDANLKIEYWRAPDARLALLLRGAGLVDLQAASPSAWHTIEIQQVGERITTRHDGVPGVAFQRVSADRGPLPRMGPLVLQAQGEVRVRAAAVQYLDSAEANRILAEQNTQGFVPIFNGRDFTGWAGPTANYQVEDGALMCRSGQGGTIYTATQYRDFVVRLEFNLPPAGNNGLAIRYPGEGDTAYVGMTELQVLDDMAAKYATLDARQAHGSAYGMVAAKRGYLRPVGEWNFQEVTVRGSRILVELNGTLILDADLSKVTSFLDDKPHPGKNRTSGHFGFAGHGDAVRFRNIRIKTLN